LFRAKNICRPASVALVAQLGQPSGVVGTSAQPKRETYSTARYASTGSQGSDDRRFGPRPARQVIAALSDDATVIDSIRYPLVVRAMRQGAADFLQKPADPRRCART
jgi:hypothetical protein